MSLDLSLTVSVALDFYLCQGRSFRKNSEILGPQTCLFSEYFDTTTSHHLNENILTAFLLWCGYPPWLVELRFTVGL